MKIGIPREIKNNEHRVAVSPEGVHELVARGHQVYIESGAGEGSRIADESFVSAGARILTTASDVWNEAELLLKVKEPLAEEFDLLREGQVLFTYLHLAASEPVTRALLAAGTTSIAYETVQLPNRSLPLLAPMSEIAGRLSVQVGAYHLMRGAGGRGTLLGGIAGTTRAKVVVLGGGMAGEHAAINALGLGADVTVIDISLPRLRELAIRYPSLNTSASSTLEIERQMTDADLVIGAALVPGAAAPKLVTDDMVSGMKEGSVLVDIAIDQGGCFAGSHATTHDEPTFAVHRSLYYCVSNMPGAVPETSTRALTVATLPYVLRIADRGWRTALSDDAALAAGLSTHRGQLTSTAVGAALGIATVDPESLLTD